MLFAVIVLASFFSAGCSEDSQEATVFEVLVENISTPQSFTAADESPLIAAFSSALWAVHSTGTSASGPFFTAGAPARSNGLEAFAEDANPGARIQALTAADGVTILGLVSETVSREGLLGPAQQYRFLITAPQGERLSLAMNFVQGNDIFVSTPDAGIALFDEAGQARSGDITAEFVLYDAGTEINQAPGLGADQTARQPRENTGATESGVVQPVNDGFVYPSVGAMLRVTVTPTQTVEY